MLRVSTCATKSCCWDFSFCFVVLMAFLCTFLLHLVMNIINKSEAQTKNRTKNFHKCGIGCTWLRDAFYHVFAFEFLSELRVSSTSLNVCLAQGHEGLRATVWIKLKRAVKGWLVT